MRRKSLSVYAGVLLLIGVFFLAGESKAYQSVPEMIRKTLPGVVVVFGSDGKGGGGSGSGFFVTSKGDVLTNYHVVKNLQTIMVETDGQQHYKAYIRAYDEEQDMALLATNVPASEYKVLPIAKYVPAIGTRVYALGAPRGLERSVLDGLVSQLWKMSDNSSLYVQISCLIVPGSSGGPVVNINGEVVGMSTWGLQENPALNFAVPATRLEPFVYYARGRAPMPAPKVNMPKEGSGFVTTNPSAFATLPRPENGYVRIAADRNGNQYDLEVYSLVREGKRVTFWTTTVLGRKDAARYAKELGIKNNEVKYVRRNGEIDFAGQQIRYHKIVFEGNWKEILNNGTADAKWRPIRPDTPESALHDYILENQSW